VGENALFHLTMRESIFVEKFINAKKNVNFMIKQEDVK
jgi:hypothetical protein